MRFTLKCRTGAGSGNGASDPVLPREIVGCSLERAESGDGGASRRQGRGADTP